MSEIFEIGMNKIKIGLENGSNFSRVIGSVIRNKEFKKEIENKTKFLNKIITKIRPIERVWCILNNVTSINDIPPCEYCKINSVRFEVNSRKGTGFSKACSSKCGNKLGLLHTKTPEVIKQAEKTKKKVLLEKYGVDHVSKIPGINKKKQKTALKNYGSLKAAYYNTAKKTIIEKYNIDNVSKLENIKEKKKETSRNNYGTDYPWQSDKGKEEQMQGILDKHGVSNISKLDEIKEKKRLTCLNNYNVDNPSKSHYIINQIKITTHKNYGVFNASQSEKIKRQKIITCMKNFGVKVPFQSEEIKQKSKITCLEKYGFEHHMKHPDHRKRARLEMIQKISERYNNDHQLVPNYNPDACRVIDEYGLKNNYNFQHAENGGEYYIKELGYWVDGYDFERNIVIEIDESHHFSNGNLKERDVRRQEEITSLLNCKFIRIKYEKSS